MQAERRRLKGTERNHLEAIGTESPDESPDQGETRARIAVWSALALGLAAIALALWIGQ